MVPSSISNMMLTLMFFVHCNAGSQFCSFYIVVHVSSLKECYIIIHEVGIIFGTLLIVTLKEGDYPEDLKPLEAYPWLIN